MNTISDMNQFLLYILGQKEPSLVIVQDKEKLNKVENFLEKGGFKKTENALSLFKSIKEGQKTFIAVSEENSKDVYDVCFQYPTGQINFFDKKSAQSLFATPSYNSSTLLILVAKEVLNALDKKGLDFRNITGLTYNS